VLSGGGPSGIQTLGALQHLEKNGYWSIKNIETIYATSVGCMIGILIALNFDWVTINDYIIKRPWHEISRLNINQVFNVFSKKGFYDLSIMHLFFKPFFDSRDISLQITMKEFFELTNIDLHFFALEINDFSIEDISYKTMPDVELLTAAYMSASIPLLFSPICVGEKCYVDGGILSNYPLEQCVHKIGNNKMCEVLAFKNSYRSNVVRGITGDSTILEFVMSIVTHLISKCQTNKISLEENACNEVLCECDKMTLSYLQETVKSQEKREKLLESGINSAEIFLKCI
jgi:predicted acylesterase/phospholipase RssA